MHFSNPDIVNGLFEAGGGIAIWLGNVRSILRDKQLRGASHWATWLFTAWGFYNLFYYPHLGQWASFLGGCVIVTGNIAWISLAWRYRKA